jgi:4-hydroxybenzoate polyprenyltransferase
MLDSVTPQPLVEPAPAPAGRPAGTPLRDVARAVRPYQWAKNLLLFVPLLMSHQFGDAGRVTNVLIAFAAFCVCASASYVVNDLWDREHDRRHPVKRNRPFAAGRLPAGAGVALALVLYAVGLAVSVLLLPRGFTAMLALYVLLTTLYSFWLKRKLLLDVFFLAGLYTMRVLAGGQAAEVEVSKWLLAFCIFFFLSLAFAKRYAELLRVQDEKAGEVPGRAYRVEDLEVMSAVGPASGYLSVLVLALYVNQSPEAAKLYESPSLLWLLCPVMLYWITRIWFIARRQGLSEDPILFAMKDRVSLLTVGVVLLLLVFATVGMPGIV